MNSNTLKRKITLFSIVALLVFAPVLADAQVYTYTTYPTYSNQVDFNRLSNDEKIAYLLQVIIQLQNTINSRSYSEPYYYGNYNRYYNDRYDDYNEVIYVRPGSSNRSSSRLDVDTLSATDIRDDEAELRGRVDFNREDEATVWFEYGEDDDDLDDRTSKRRLTDSGRDERTFTQTVDDLDEDERYYFRAVAEDEDGDREYGQVRSFTTDDDRDYYDRDDFRLSVSDRSIDEGDDVEVDWEIPRREEGNRNWIGLFEIGDSDRDYITRRYLEDDDEGTERFRIYDRGTYEFRLFLDNSFDEEETSSRVEVF